MGIFSKKSKRDEPGAESDKAQEPAVRHASPSTGNLVVNVLVQDALRPWSAAKSAMTMYGVLRQCVTGELLIDTSGSQIANRSAPFSEGDTLAVGTQVDSAGRRLLLAFTDNDRLALFHQKGGSISPPISLGQSASATLRMAASTYDGIAIDPGSPDTLFIAYADEIRRGLTDEVGINEVLKEAVLAGNPVQELVELADAARVIFVGVSTRTNDQGEVETITVPSIQGPDGQRYHPAFTSPAEVWAWGADLDARPTAFSNIVRSARQAGQAGIAFDPAGPPGVIPIDAVADRY